jgi:hypothetical protein
LHWLTFSVKTFLPQLKGAETNQHDLYEKQEAGYGAPETLSHRQANWANTLGPTIDHCLFAAISHALYMVFASHFSN